MKLPQKNPDADVNAPGCCKLKLNHGDLKATQGDTGNAQIHRITSMYTNILGENRKVGVRKFEDAFWTGANPHLPTVRPPAKTWNRGNRRGCRCT